MEEKQEEYLCRSVFLTAAYLPNLFYSMNNPSNFKLKEVFQPGVLGPCEDNTNQGPIFSPFPPRDAGPVLSFIYSSHHSGCNVPQPQELFYFNNEKIAQTNI